MPIPTLTPVMVASTIVAVTAMGLVFRSLARVSAKCLGKPSLLPHSNGSGSLKVLMTSDISNTETEVGNYLSPTIRRSPSGSRKTSRTRPRRSSAARVEQPLGLYIHPLLPQAVQILLLQVYTDKNASEIEVYLALIKENEITARMPALQGRQLRPTCFGGTPPSSGEKQLRYLVEGLNRHVSWENEEVTFECEPGTLRKSKLETLKDIASRD